MICVTIRDVSYHKAIQYAGMFPFVEFRLESIPVSVEEARHLFSIPRKSIATCRPVLGTTDGRRKEMLGAGILYGADFVDIEINAEGHLLEELRGELAVSNTKLIVSYHNFEQTPGESELLNLYEKAIKLNADIVKIACAVHTMEDNLRLLSFSARYPEVLAIGMGNSGRISRVLAPFFGSPFSYAYPDDQCPAAPGQFPYHQLKQLQEELERNIHGRF